MPQPLPSRRWRDLTAQSDARASAMVLGLVCFVVAAGAMADFGIKQVSAQQQTAQVKLHTVKQIALTEKQIQGLIAGHDGMQKIFDNTAEDPSKYKPDTIAMLDDVARTNGLSSYAEYENVSENVGLVLGGYDPVTRKYVGKEALIRLQVARVKADKKLSPEDKKEQLQFLSDDKQLPLAPIENKNNIALVLKYVDKLSGVLGGD